MASGLRAEMSARRHALSRRHALAAALVLLQAGCAVQKTSPTPAPTAPGGAWSGRLALAVRGDAPQSWAAGFELRGSPEAGELRLLSPLGSALAQARWSPSGASLQTGSEERRFDSMDALLQELAGTALPLDALFDWLQGRPAQAPGWQADLSRHAEGRLSARRQSPEPVVELRIFLDAP